jgi:hypothetical protein
MERVADPTVVTALLSLVLATRNQLATIGFSHVCLFNSFHLRDLIFTEQVIPRDPFLNSEGFATGLGHYIQSTNLSLPGHSSPHLYNLYPSHYPFHHSRTNTASTIPSVGSTAPNTDPLQHGYPNLTRTLVENISAAYDRFRQNDARKMHKVIWNKLDTVVGGDRDRGRDRDGSDYDPDAGRERGGRGRRDGAGGTGGEIGGLGIGGSGQLLSGIGSLASGLGLGGGGADGGASILEGTMDIAGFVKVVIRRGKGEKGDGGKERDAGVGASIRTLWSGRVSELVGMREREKERVLGSLGKIHKGKGDIDRVWSDGDKDSDREKTDGHMSTEEESEVVSGLAGKPWSGRVQKKIESWTG